MKCVCPGASDACSRASGRGRAGRAGARGPETPGPHARAGPARLSERKQRLTGLGRAHEILLWHSGKDLLAAMAGVLPGRFKNHPKVFLSALRDWARENPQPALAIFPEWQALLAQLNAS